jgi:hypothetical protein
MLARVLGTFALVWCSTAGAASVHGTVTSGKAPPAAATIPVTRDQGTCGTSQPDESLVVNAGRRIQNVVVYVVNPPKGPSPAPAAEALLDQVGCRYVPHVQAARVGTKLVALNSDAMLHTVRGTSNGETLFNTAQPLKGMKSSALLAKPGLIHVGCDAGHTWMSAWVYAFEHPYYAMTGADGQFEIPGLAPGPYELGFWHETLGTLRRQVTVDAAGGTLAVTMPAQP